ncbi:MAG: hypothetical protein K5637_07840 [Lachnospiraceae bacterium]|nr:hypothetical protein [Lachnospiraceae bacterium]
MEIRELFAGIDICRDGARLCLMDRSRISGRSMPPDTEESFPVTMQPDAGGEDFIENVLESVIREAGSRNTGSVIKRVGITMEEIDFGTDGRVAGVMEKLGFDRDSYTLMSHSRSYAYYALSQARDTWIKGAGLFESNGSRHIYRDLRVVWADKPVSCHVTETDCSQMLLGPLTDQGFAGMVSGISRDHPVSAYYLTGHEFREDSDISWMKESLKLLGANRRRVFIGENIYARGALFGAIYLERPSDRPAFVIKDNDGVYADVSVRTMRRGTASSTMLLGRNDAWYDAQKRLEVLTDGGEDFFVRIKDPGGNESTALLRLTGIPQRKGRTTRLLLEASMASPVDFELSVIDLGFGEIFESSGMSWKFDIDLADPPAAENAPEEPGMTAAIIPVNKADYLIPASGLTVSTPEELCWYIAENPFSVNNEFFDEDMLSWLDAVTGDSRLSSGIRGYISAGKPAEDTARFLLKAVDYQDNAEIQKITSLIGQIGKQNPVELTKAIADSYYENGLYMAALRCYHRAMTMMNGEHEKISVRPVKAAIWHNMGLTYLKLMDYKCARECMEKACSLAPGKKSVKDYLMVCRLAGDESQLMYTAGRYNLSQKDIGSINEEYDEASSRYDQDPRGRHMQQQLGRGSSENEDEYRQFAQYFIARQKKRFAV